MTKVAPKPHPVRAGDVYQFDETRVATVMRTRPGGIAELRINGERNGRPSLQLGDYPMAEVKTWPFLGRAQFRDGLYSPIHAVGIS